jgi:ADP-ribosyl-[dinitrogen reductase] hydrolase
VVYSVERLDTPPRHCSCAVCRKAHAAAFNTSASVKRSGFRWLQGEAGLRWYESSPGKRRYFCGNCGSQLVAHREGSPTMALRVATLDEDPGLRPAAHIWAASEVPWLAYGSEVPVFQGWEPDAS